MDDNSLMPFGQFKGKPLKTVRASYWRWFLKEHWARENWPLLLEYAEKKLGMKAPPRKKRKLVVTEYREWVGNPDAGQFNDGTCPF